MEGERGNAREGERRREMERDGERERGRERDRDGERETFNILFLLLSLQMLINVYCNEKMEFQENVCCKGLPKPTKMQFSLLMFFAIM